MTISLFATLHFNIYKAIKSWHGIPSLSLLSLSKQISLIKVFFQTIYIAEFLFYLYGTMWNSSSNAESKFTQMVASLDIPFPSFKSEVSKYIANLSMHHKSWPGLWGFDRISHREV